MKVAIIGGGPVGLITALLLAKRGYNVDLFEKSSWPKDKACGQGIMPSGVKILDSLGITFSEGEDCFSFNGVTYIDGGHILNGLLERKGLGVERKILSQKIFKACKENSLINLYDGHELKDIFNFEDVVSLILDNGKETMTLNYDYAFACDGLNSLVRKKLGNRSVRQGTFRSGAREHFSITPWSRSVQVYWNNGVEAYVTPVSDQRVEVAFLWYEGRFSSKSGLREKLWDCFPELRNQIFGGDELTATEDFRGYGPFSSFSTEERVGRTFFLGDAYCFLDGITGEGLSLGFKGASIVARNFENWGFFPQLRFKWHYFHYKFMVNLALTLSQHKGLRSFLFRFVGKFPSSFNWILKLNDL